MAEIETIEIINNQTEIIEDKPIEIIDRRKIKKNKKVEEEPVEKIDKQKFLRELWRTTILEDGTKNTMTAHVIHFILRNIMTRNVKL